MRSDDQSKVSTETMTMIATRATTGTCDTQRFSATMRISSRAPANSVDSRPRPPYFTLLTVCPIMPHPAMPPNRLDATLARPRPQLSRSFELGVPVRSSTTLAVISDSSSPTAAMARAGPAMIRSVSRLSGTAGQANSGSASGRRPRSATVRTGR